MSWYLLFVAGVFEIGWALGLEYSDGLSEPVPTAITGIAILASMVCLGLAIENIPVGTAYAVWTGIGVVGTAIAGVVLFDEQTGLIRLVCISLIVVGVVGLRLTSRAH